MFLSYIVNITITYEDKKLLGKKIV